MIINLLISYSSITWRRTPIERTLLCEQGVFERKVLVMTPREDVHRSPRRLLLGVVAQPRPRPSGQIGCPKYFTKAHEVLFQAHENFFMKNEIRKHVHATSEVLFYAHEVWSTKLRTHVRVPVPDTVLCKRSTRVPRYLGTRVPWDKYFLFFFAKLEKTKYFSMQTKYFFRPTKYFFRPAEYFFMSTKYFLCKRSTFIMPMKYFFKPTKYFNNYWFI
jgi:hypothetical protein